METKKLYEIENTKVYEIMYYKEGQPFFIKIRALNASGAKRVCKRLTGCLMREMKIHNIWSWTNTAANDKEV